ncbi:MAG TPA: phosphoribosylformylglycinamidine synthase subunit PurQ, partial [Verrucomicrobiae bacterium]|nr:phosphoribosylformylglycinamidine synthase subunit PurQ [Verrucomicrobiae bacterium]
DPQQIKCSGNWMWAAKKPGEGPRLLEAAEAAERLMIMLGMAIDGGKDSLSMAVKLIGEAGVEEIIKAPGQFIVATYAATSDFTKRVTPDLKRPGNHLYWLDLGLGQARLGGSALAQTFNQIGMECPDVNDTQALKKTFEGVQQLILEGVVESVHDVSDGGLITAVLEMAFAGNTGLKLDLAGNRPVLSTLFAEEPGLVLELTPGSSIMALGLLKGELELPIVKIGEVGEYGGKVVVQHNHNRVLDDSMVELRSVWEETGNRLERLQADPDCTIQQEQSLRVVTEPPYGMTFTPVYPNDNPAIKPRVALLREEGTNGDREMAATLMLVGFEVQDVTTNDLIAGNVSLDEFVGLVFPGGFSFGDVLDSAKGWAGVIRFNEELARQFERFRNRKNTFSLGVCNGAQLSPLLGCVPGFDVSENLQPRFIRNKSGRFESRFTTVRIEESPAIMFKGMAGSILGIWLAHGEGQFRADRDILDWMLDEKLAPVRYVDNEGSPTEVYPFNPNGSPQGIAAICSQDGRHVAIMPHLERTSLPWQWPWVPQEWRKDFNASPWLKAFQNLYEWCVSNLVH